MFNWKHKKGVLLLLLVVIIAASAFVLNRRNDAVDFNTQIKPILNKNCITCHGGVRRQGNFSLLFRADAVQKAKSGKYAIIPGDAGHSEMIRRIRSTDPEERMPFKHAPLTSEEIDLLVRWINQGAKWGQHWAYVPVQPVTVPRPTASFFGLIPAKKIDWARNDIDYFINDRLTREGLRPSPEASPDILLRRVSLDLTGLPPSPKMAAMFAADRSDGAYERLVDSLLASPAYGEKMTAMWLDLARYADTKGYERDDSRSIWRYRDYLIRSFNEDKPYNRFLTEQLAGDLLPGATDEDYIATAFNRNTMTNDEGGTDNEEFRTAAVIDRVNTTWQVLMGTTFGCVQCHSHPYDPFKHDEYYQFLAFYNDTRDEDTYADYPLLREYAPADSVKMAGVLSWLDRQGFSDRVSGVSRFLKTWQPAINSLTADSFVNSELSDSKWLIFRNHGIARLRSVDLGGKSRLIYRYQGFLDQGTWVMHLDSPSGPVLASMKVPRTKDWTITQVDFPAAGGVHDIYITYSNPTLKKPGDSGLLFDWFYFTEPLPGSGRPGYDQVEKDFRDLVNAPVTTTPVMMDNPADMHRPTHVFVKGNWLVPGEVVQPGVPASLNPFPNQAPRNRLGMALWLTSRQNPLTARTLVNRVWEQLFGKGIVETLEDMGTQGAAPTHQALLDDLAWHFMNDYRWSVKRLVKEIVLSATYRQDSRVTPAMLAADPADDYYERAPRVRLSAEEIHDQALQVSGLLSPKMYGPSVMPWEPAGIWLSPWNGAYWQTSTGEDGYRRALYTYWKRTAPYPAMITFDATSREVCLARRISTNTPLQALTTMNDSFYVVAARHLAYRMIRETASNSPLQMIEHGYELAMDRPVTRAKLDALCRLYLAAFERFSTDAEATCEMVGMNDRHNNAETAALVVVASALLNLDEFVTKN